MQIKKHFCPKTESRNGFVLAILTFTRTVKFAYIENESILYKKCSKNFTFGPVFTFTRTVKFARTRNESIW